MDSLKAWHLYARYHNFGDYALGLGLRNLFERYFRPPLVFKLFDIHDTRFDAAKIEHLNAGADLLIAGGGGLIRQTNKQWLFKMPNDLIPRVQVPMVFYGLGYNHFQNEPELYPEVLENLKCLQDAALSFSVRNDGSQARLAALGFDAPEVPDPGFFVDGDYLVPAIPSPYMVMQLVHPIPNVRDFSVGELLSELKQVVEWLNGHGYHVVLAPHVWKDDAVGAELMEMLGHPPGVSKWNWFHMIRDECTTEGLGVYKHAAFVIGMRGHAQICPIGMGTPVISVASHPKHVGLVAKLGLPEMLGHVGEKGLALKIIEFIRYIEGNRNALVHQMGNKMDELTAQSQQFLGALSRDMQRVLSEAK